MIKLLRKNEEFKYADVQNGCLALINKDPGWTSFDVVNKIRRIVKIKKVGHAGTLDPFADGLLIIGIAGGTKSLGRLTGLSKLYTAKVCLGVSTNTFDCTGDIVDLRSTAEITIEMIKNAFKKLEGEIFQQPPMFSAKKVNGKRLYELARKNIEVERKAVKVIIHNVDILDWQNPILKVRLKVSKGTYIRAFANDLGHILGCGAHLSQLKRDGIDDYMLADALSIQEFSANWKLMTEKFYGNN
jgi:tRNA pseudouridine55 synthase